MDLTFPAVEPRPRRWSARTLLLAWSIPVVLGTPLAILSLPGTGPPVGVLQVLLIVCASWYSWAAMTPVIVRLAERWRLERPFAAGVVVIHVFAALLACLVQASTTTIATLVLAPTPGVGPVGIFTYWILLILPGGVVVYAAVVGIRIAELNRTELLARERQLSEARLGALRAQIQPHFLFNTLNAVIALVRDQETRSAVEALTTLSSLLRTALRTGATHEVTLGEELTFTTNYLSIEQLRFGDRLCVGVDVPAELRDTRVPSFLLQPFVENALRHGLRRQSEPLHVDISARADLGRLTVLVEDDGMGLSPDWEARSASGFGIANSRARLRQLYGPEASLTIGRRGDAGRTFVEIVLPLRRLAA